MKWPIGLLREDPKVRFIIAGRRLNRQIRKEVGRVILPMADWLAKKLAKVGIK